MAREVISGLKEANKEEGEDELDVEESFDRLAQEGVFRSSLERSMHI